MYPMRYALISAWTITRVTHSCMHLSHQNDRKLQELIGSTPEVKQQPILKHIRKWMFLFSASILCSCGTSWHPVQHERALAARRQISAHSLVHSPFQTLFSGNSLGIPEMCGTTFSPEPLIFPACSPKKPLCIPGCLAGVESQARTLDKG